MINHLEINKEKIEYDLEYLDESKIVFTLSGIKYEYCFSVNVLGNIVLSPESNSGVCYEIPRYKHAGNDFFNIDGHDITVKKKSVFLNSEENDDDMSSPMPGKILKVLVKCGDKVSKGDALIVMEAMKMEHTIKAVCDGEVTEIFHAEGEMVEGDVPLIQVV